MNHAPKFIVSAAACAALAISAAGCGEKEEPATTGPVITQTTSPTTTTSTVPGGHTSPSIIVDAFLTSQDAQKVCGQFLTPKFLRKEYGGERACLAARKPATLAKPDPKQRVSGGDHRPFLVVAEPRGGRYDGKKLRFLIDENDVRIISLSTNAGSVGK